MSAVNRDLATPLPSAIADTHGSWSGSTMTDKARRSNIAVAGLPESAPHVEEALREAGVDPDRLSISKLGTVHRFPAAPPWLLRLTAGTILIAAQSSISAIFPDAPLILIALLQLFAGLVMLMAACEVLVTATERMAARLHWNHYTAGTVAEILSTTPELVVIAFLVPVSPLTAFVICLITIYNNALVFSLYSFFLPKDRYGKFLMPVPITKAGTQILIGGGAMGLVLGLVMLTLNTSPQAKSSFESIDLAFVSLVLLCIFAVYVYKLATSYAREEAEVRENLAMSSSDIQARLDSVYENIRPTSRALIGVLFLAGVAGAFVGGHEVSRFDDIMLDELQFNPILTGLILALFAGMSEYVILWHSHRKREYGIALANAFGGITQVMFLVLPFTLLSIAFYQSFLNPAHPELPLEFSVSNILLLLFLFPTFYTLSSLLENDHTLGILDTVIMTGLFLFLIVLLVTHGANPVP
jgi:hypothetical protein